MKTLKQITEQVKESINQFIEETENGEILVEKSTEEMKKRIQEAKGLIATAIVEEQRLKREYQQVIEALNSLREKTETASQSLDAENEKEAQHLINQHQNRANELEGQIHEQEQVINELTGALKDFYQQFHEISIKLKELSQRHQQAKTRSEFNKILAEFELSDANNVIQHAEEALRKAEAEAKQWEKRRQRNSEQSDMKKEEAFNVDDALEALKRDILGSND